MGKENTVVSPQVVTKQPVRSLRADSCLTVAMAEEVPVEHTLDVVVNGRRALQLVCTATSLRELVVGRLYSEGIIAAVGDIEALRFDESLSTVRVSLRKAVPLTAKATEVVPTAVTGTRVFVETPEQESDSRKVTPIPWKAEDIFSLARVFSSDSPMHRTTCGVHSCYLAQGAEVLCRCEDLGRHNAFDKAVGYGLLHGIDLKRCTVFSSGRLPIDMLKKAVRVGIPLVVSKSVTTDRAVRLARESDLTLICSAWPDSLRVYHDPRDADWFEERPRSICA